jgi:SAM-dependent methyltransferase
VKNLFTVDIEDWLRIRFGNVLTCLYRIGRFAIPLARLHWNFHWNLGRHTMTFKHGTLLHEFSSTTITDFLQRKRFLNVRSERTDNFDGLCERRHNWSYSFNRVLHKEVLQRVEKTRETLEGIEGFTVLDVGCGSCRNSALFADLGARRVVGIDFSAPVLELAREYARAARVVEQCEFIQADFLDYPFHETFDVVVALGVFDYIADSVRALKRMTELANDKVVASFPGVSPIRAPLRKLCYALRGCPVYFYTGAGLRQICHEAGLAKFRIDKLASSGYMLVGRKNAAKRRPVANG